MKALFKYALFVVILGTVAYAAVNPDLPVADLLPGYGTKGKNPVGHIPSLSSRPSQVLGGRPNAGAIDFHPGKGLLATGEEGWIKVWQLPEEKPVAAIDAGEGFQVRQVRFQPGKETIAGGGVTAEGRGAVRIFETASGKQVSQIENPEPVLYLDFDRSGRYLIVTGTSQIRVWDGVESQAVSIFPKDSAASRGVFFMEDRVVLQTDTLSYYDWKNRKKIAGPEAGGPLTVRKINESLCAWISGQGLQTLHSPEGKREFLPFDTQGIYAFDLAPDGKWGLFLKEDKVLSLIDCASGRTVTTVGLKRRPEVVRIDGSGAGAYVVYPSGTIEVYELGNENIFRNARFYTGRFFSRLWIKASALAGRSQKLTPSVP
jgi:hypothetical protein